MISSVCCLIRISDCIKATISLLSWLSRFLGAVQQSAKILKKSSLLCHPHIPRAVALSFWMVLFLKSKKKNLNRCWTSFFVAARKTFCHLTLHKNTLERQASPSWCCDVMCVMYSILVITLISLCFAVVVIVKEDRLLFDNIVKWPESWTTHVVADGWGYFFF